MQRVARVDTWWSFAWRSSATSRLSRLISACSSLVSPGRRLSSTTARRTHFRSVSVGPDLQLLRNRPIVAHCDG
jgi:hypothetical protein